MALKPVQGVGPGVGFEGIDLGVAFRVLRAARDAAGLAAYHYFFKDASPDARAAYLSAIEAEAEAELLLGEMRGDGSGPGAP